MGQRVMRDKVRGIDRERAPCVFDGFVVSPEMHATRRSGDKGFDCLRIVRKERQREIERIKAEVAANKQKALVRTKKR